MTAANAAFGCPEARSSPVINGPTNPPRLPTALMNPTEVAAASRDTLNVGSAQNPGIQAKMDAPAIRMNASAAIGGMPGVAASTTQHAAVSIGTHACSLRSPDLSDDRAAAQRATT